MDEATFWRIIDRAREPNASADQGRLAALLSGLSEEEVLFFGQEFRRQMVRLYRWSVWCAAYVVQGGASDDGFLYFCENLVGRGREAVETALNDPDALGPYLSDDDEANENEELGSVAREVLAKRGIADGPIPYPEGSIEPEGEPFDEDSVYEAYPRLASAFG